MFAGAILMLAVSTPTPATPAPDTRQLSALLKRVLLAELPKVHEESDDWGKQAKIFDGLKAEGKGKKFRLAGKTKLVNHGTWKRSKLVFTDPERQIDVEIRDLRGVDRNRVAFELVTTLSFQGEAETKTYSNGLQLFGVTARADATVCVRLACEVAFWLDPAGLGSTLRVEPTIRQCSLELVAFDLNRLGPSIKGDLAHELGDDLRGHIRKLMRKNEAKVREKANEAIGKSMARGDLSFSPAKLLGVAPMKANQSQKK